MRRMSRLFLHLSLGLSVAGFMAAPVLAQDLGTYRPGQAYQSVASPTADVCNSHCAGDAQCNAWNYVKVNPQAPGVCEFLSSASAPVQSAISISGENTSQSRFSRRTTQGSTNTVRVGTSSKPAPASASISRTPTRRIVREAVPQRVVPQATVNRQTRPDPRLQQQRLQQQYLQQQRLQQLHQQQQRQVTTQQRSQFKPLLDGVVPNVQPVTRSATRSAARPTSRPVAPPNQQSVREQLRQNQARQSFQGPAYQGQGPQRQASVQPDAKKSDGRPPVGKPIGPVNSSISEQNARLQPQQQASQRVRQGRDSTHLPRASANAPVTSQNAREAFARRQADLAAIASGNSVDPITKSLYGSLNDDVKVRAPLKTLPSDPEAPIATTASRPVEPVQVQPLSPISDVQLAGGPS